MKKPQERRANKNPRHPHANNMLNHMVYFMPKANKIHDQRQQQDWHGQDSLSGAIKGMNQPNTAL